MRTWFITGASRGFGALIAEKALSVGDSVIATARNPESVIRRLGHHSNLTAVRLDVNDESTIHDAVSKGIKRFGRIDVLVNNAGYGLLGAVEEASKDEIESLFRTNVFGLLAVTKAVLPHMRKQRSGHIINISSIGGFEAFTGWGVYCATKFAVEGLTEALAYELSPLGINATVVEPGFFRTDFLDEQSLVTSKSIIEDYHDTSGNMRSLAHDLNHAQPGDPVKLADAICALVDLKEPPLRLPLGSDTVDVITKKTQFVQRELAKWKVLSLSTDFNEY